MERLETIEEQRGLVGSIEDGEIEPHTDSKQRAAHILVVDARGQARRIAEFVLTDAGYRVATLAHLQSFAQAVDDRRPDLVLLTISEPDAKALEQCRELRRQSSVPIVLLSTHASAEHKARGLRCGADDYLGTPYEPSELLARVAAILRRRRRQIHFPIARLRRGTLTLDTAAQQVSAVDGQLIAVTPIETRLLHYLMTNADRLLTLEEIALMLWDDDSPDARVRVQVNISRLRKKLAAAQVRMPLTTYRGAGYCFEADDDSTIPDRSVSPVGNSS